MLTGAEDSSLLETVLPTYIILKIPKSSLAACASEFDEGQL